MWWAQLFPVCGEQLRRLPNLLLHRYALQKVCMCVCLPTFHSFFLCHRHRQKLHIWLSTGVILETSNPQCTTAKKQLSLEISWLFKNRQLFPVSQKRAAKRDVRQRYNLMQCIKCHRLWWKNSIFIVLPLLCDCLISAVQQQYINCLRQLMPSCKCSHSYQQICILCVGHVNYNGSILILVRHLECVFFFLLDLLYCKHELHHLVNPKTWRSFLSVAKGDVSSALHLCATTNLNINYWNIN